MKKLKFYEEIYNFMKELKLGRIFPHVLAYPDQNAEKSRKGGGEGELSRIEHAAKQQLKIWFPATSPA